MITTEATGLIHRDLKSANLLVTSDWKVKVCDFGLARARPTEEDAAMMTVAGTMEWMAPEVSLCLPYDTPCDVFSFGTTIYTMGYRGVGVND